MKYTFAQCNALVTKWHEDRNTIKGSTLVHQYAKLSEELMYEFFTGYQNDDYDLMTDSIGDALVVMNCMIHQLGYNPDDVIGQSTAEPRFNSPLALSAKFGEVGYSICRNKPDHSLLAISELYREIVNVAHWLDIDVLEAYNTAYDEIKDRKGTMISNIFVKEQDIEKVQDNSTERGVE